MSKIVNFNVGREKIFIIAELSANHGHDVEIAKETIRAAKRAGADAIKLQTYTADTMTIDSDKEDFIIKGGTLWDKKKLYDLYKEAYTPWEWHKELFEVSKNEGLICFSSPFDNTAIDLLEELGNPIYKIASFEITDIPLIKHAASKGKPMIMSTGIATDEDIQLAIDTCKSVGNDQIVLLKCTSAYPAPIDEANLAMIPDFVKRFNIIPGLSDHTMGITVPIMSVAFGARVIEKHFILDKSIGGPDAAFSLDEVEFAQMAKAVRDAEKAIGTIDYNLTEKQQKGKQFARSLYVVEDVKAGEVFTEKNMRSIRPGYGLHPQYYYQILGRIASSDIIKGTALNWDLIL